MTLRAVLAGLVCAVGACSSANAAIFDYNFNARYASYNVNPISGPENGQGGWLTGSLSLDDAGTGNGIISAYNLSTYLPNPFGGIYRSALFDSATAAQSFTVSVNTGVATVNFLTPVGGERQRLILSFNIGDIGGSALPTTASDQYLKCKGVFWGGAIRNSCSLPNYGIGLGSGVIGGNGGTSMLGASANGPTPSPVPLPAGAPLLAAGLGMMGVLRYRRKTKNA